MTAAQTLSMHEQVRLVKHGIFKPNHKNILMFKINFLHDSREKANPLFLSRKIDR